MKVKLAQRELRKDMYGDDFKARLAALQGDNDAIEKLKRDQKLAFDKRLAALLEARKKTHLLDCNEEDVNEIETFSADWAAQQVGEGKWRQMSEQERQAVLMKVKLAQRQLREQMLKESFGDEWKSKLESMMKNEADYEKWRSSKVNEFNDRLMKMLALNKANANLEDISENENEDAACADWVKQQMDEAEWARLSEKEKQALIAKAKLEQRKLKKEMFGDDWMKHLRYDLCCISCKYKLCYITYVAFRNCYNISIISSEMSANEDNLNEAKRIQREEFNKRLLAAMALKAAAQNDADEVDGKENENILVKIVKKKYEFIEKFDQSEAIQIQRNAEIEFVKDLDKDEVIYVFLGNVYLYM